MRKFSFTIFILCFSTQLMASDFCDGFKDGYIAGYKKVHRTLFRPLSPFCPFQPIKGFNDPISNYNHGYNIGLQEGRRA